MDQIDWQQERKINAFWGIWQFLFPFYKVMSLISRIIWAMLEQEGRKQTSQTRANVCNIEFKS